MAGVTINRLIKNHFRFNPCSPQIINDALQSWVNTKTNEHLALLERIEYSLDNGNHEAYRVAFNQLRDSICTHEETQRKLFEQITERLI